MNQKRSILNLFVCLSAILLVVLATSVVVSADEPAAEKTDAAFLAANPELMFARHYVAEAAKVSAGEPADMTDAAFLAANPELMFARRYIAEAAEKAAAFSACYEGRH